MKILKKLLLIGLFSFAFCVNASADTRDIQYVDSTKTWINENREFYDKIIQYIKDNASVFDSHSSGLIDITNDKNIMRFQKEPYINSNGEMQIFIVPNFPSGDSRKIEFNSSGWLVHYYIRAYLKYDVETGEFLGVSRIGSLESSSANTYYADEFFDDWFFDWKLGKNTETLILNNSSYDFIINSNNQVFGAKSTFTGTFYNFVEAVNYGYIGDDYYDLDYFEDSEVITYKIKDEEVGKDKELNIRFTFLDNLDILTDYINIYKYGSQVYTQQIMTCSHNENNTICDFNLKYDVNELNDDKIMFDFKFNDKYNVKIEDNSGNNGVYSNHKDVEYEIKIINLKEKSGGVFYLRNYDNYEYLSSFYEEDYFGFSLYSSHPSNIKFDKVIYPNAIQYKNNYIYKGSDNFYHFDSGSYVNINNFGYFSVPFEFNSSLLLENKYSSFVIRNRNYLGSGDIDNQELYVSYNSSLFNINVLESSNIVEDGIVDNFIGTNIDFNFIVNGNQNSFEVGVITGERFEFDEDIKVSYNNGFEYFKDKIIDVFELVSDFFNTMPQKFKIAFSFIFVLLIGIALFRLLL